MDQMYALWIPKNAQGEKAFSNNPCGEFVYDENDFDQVEFNSVEGRVLLWGLLSSFNSHFNLLIDEAEEEYLSPDLIPEAIELTHLAIASANTPEEKDALLRVLSALKLAEERGFSVAFYW